VYQSTRSWYTTDPFGSIRVTLSEAGIASSAANYDPWGELQSGTLGRFGYTGELQQGSNVYLRARWYGAQNGQFYGRDPYPGMAEMPYSQHSFQYGYSNPISNTDPSGRLSGSQSAKPAPPIEYPLDIGFMIGVSVAGVAAVAGGAAGGVEQVFNLYDFEAAYFAYGGFTSIATKDGFAVGGITAILDQLTDAVDAICPGSASLTVYVGAVSGWGNFPRSRGIKNYAGPFQVDTASGGGVAKLLLPGFVGASLQTFRSPDGNLSGLTAGIGISTEFFKVTASRMNLTYSAPYLPQRFHPTDPSVIPVGWAPPSEAQAQQFIAYINLTVSSYLFFGPPLAAKMVEIVRYNQRAWRNLAAEQKQP
jgi:RHS repeat-associated protein